MADRARSPKRAHILASINPPISPLRKPKKRQASPPKDTPAEDPLTEEQARFDGDDYRAPRASRFRFKSKNSKSSRHCSRSRSRERASRDDPDGHRSRRRHHRRKRRRSASPRRDREGEPARDEEEDPFAPPPLDSDTAFRAALFDAMADDEGAAYWEGVYGQPLHVYERERARETPRGELERMSDDEYAAHVRQRMWEKTHAGALEARERRAREREAAAREGEEQKRADKKRRREEKETELVFEREWEREEDERKRRERHRRWADYVAAWAGWDGTVAGVRWPVSSGNRSEAGDDEAVRAFFVHGLDLRKLGGAEFATRLKDERVRWHPDKMQQRLGAQMDEALMREVTRIFQIIDGLWNDTRPKI